jgi:hypothetical protein
MTEQQRRPTQAPSRPGPVELCVDRRRSPAWPGQLRLGLPETTHARAFSATCSQSLRWQNRLQTLVLGPRNGEICIAEPHLAPRRCGLVQLAVSRTDARASSRLPPPARSSSAKRSEFGRHEEHPKAKLRMGMGAPPLFATTPVVAISSGGETEAERDVGVRHKNGACLQRIVPTSTELAFRTAVAPAWWTWATKARTALSRNSTSRLGRTGPR